MVVRQIFNSFSYAGICSEAGNSCLDEPDCPLCSFLVVRQDKLFQAVKTAIAESCHSTRIAEPQARYRSPTNRSIS